MRNHNSRSDFYITLFEALYHDVVGAISPQSDQSRDLDTVRSRYCQEGMSFFTVTLPRLGKAVMQSLGTGTRLQHPNFARSKGTELPAFCGTLFSLVFRPDGFPIFWKLEPPGLREVGGSDRPGVRKDSNECREASVVALKALLQLTMSFYKLDVPYTHEKESKVLEDFVETDREVPESFPDSDQRVILSIARKLIARVVNGVDPLSGVPRHGPGAVATGEKSHQKHHFKRFYTRLNRVFPYDEWFYYNSSHLCDSLQELQAMETHEAGTAKVVLVPKDSRGPRLISCEPLEYQWIQQSLLGVLVPQIESHPWTRGHVNFTDQSINQRLALESSLSSDMATLDMKEASDRVGLALVRELFSDQWYEALYASRSPRTKLPDGRIVDMKKFAPMGSAVCFPIEALVFWSLSVAALIAHGLEPEEARANVYVYGDDIICHSDHHAMISSTLDRFGLKLNLSKCCVTGFFRESCGMEAYLGHPVTPTKIRRTWSPRRKPGCLSSYVALSNALYDKGYFESAKHIEDSLREIWGHIPILPCGRTGVLAFVRQGAAFSTDNPKRILRYNRELFRMEIRGLSSRPTPILATGSGWALALRESRMHGLITLDGSNPLKEIPSRLPTCQYTMTHRDKLSRVWAPLAH